MQATCDHCGSKHILDDRQVGSNLRVQFRCASCGQATLVNVDLDPGRTTASFVRADAVPFVEPTVVSEKRGLALPPDKVISLTVTQGSSQGLKYKLDRSRVIVGRLGADLAVNDPQVSRWHCAVEVSGEQVQLRDLDSRNGVFVNGERVYTAELKHQSEFHIGSTVIQLSITPK